MEYAVSSLYAKAEICQYFLEDFPPQAGLGSGFGRRAIDMGSGNAPRFLFLSLLFINVFFRFDIRVLLFEFFKAFQCFVAVFPIVLFGDDRHGAGVRRVDGF